VPQSRVWTGSRWATRLSKSTRPGPRKEEEEGEVDVVADMAVEDMAVDVVEVDMAVDVGVVDMAAAAVAMEADRAGTEAEDTVSSSRVDTVAADTVDTRAVTSLHLHDPVLQILCICTQNCNLLYYATIIYCCRL